MIRSFLIILVLSLSIFAQGPNKFAKCNRALWPHQINSPAAFDFASQMEMLAFIVVFNEHDSLKNDIQLRQYLGLKKVSPESVSLWRKSMEQIFIVNFNNCRFSDSTNFLNLSLPLTWESIVSKANEFPTILPEKYLSWYQNAKEFYKLYLYEQMRLAALFPRISSEILTFESTEIQGTEFKDKEFLLTLDDGPSIKDGNTDKLIEVLNKENIPGYFFVLGERFSTRLNTSSAASLKNLYGNHRIGSHGYIHKAHPRYELWKNSLSQTDSLIQLTFGYASKHFRPPYGQRNPDIVKFLKDKNSQVILWNIDSQDWSSKMSSDEVSDRVETLMLFWRKGIILFHDIHPKAATTLPKLQERIKGGEIKWIDFSSL